MESWGAERQRRIPPAVSPEGRPNEGMLTVEQARHGLMEHIRAFAQSHPDAPVIELQGPLISLATNAKAEGIANQKIFEQAISEIRKKINTLDLHAPISEALALLDDKGASH